MKDLALVDSHCHFDLLEGRAPAEVIQEAQNFGVQYFLNVCVSINDFPSVLNVAQQYPFVYASVGLHPNTTDETIDVENLVKLAQAEKVVAIGETGLDYYRSTGELDWQRSRFDQHIEAALITQKPLIVHTRAAKEDTIEHLRQMNAAQVGGVMHCFTEDWSMAKQALDLNFYISFSGIVTFNSAKVLQEVAKNVPDDRILIETDAPYLAPNPKRGKPNTPGYVYYTAEYLAKLRGVPIEQLAETTTENFFTLFKGATRHV